MDDHLGFAVNGQYNRLTGLFHLPHEFGCISFEDAKTLNVAGEFHASSLAYVAKCGANLTKSYLLNDLR